MGYQAGEIYFIRERDGAGQITPYVKIGLVRYTEGRDSFTRLAEHQTGNPRQLLLDGDGVVKTQAVDRVEALLHRHYATSRVSGEWFEFENDQGLAQAMQRARELAAESESLVPILAEAEALERVPSDGTIRPPTDEEVALGSTLAIAKQETKTYDGLLASIRQVLSFAVDQGRDVQAVATVQVREFKPKFQPQRVKELHPELWAQFQILVPEWEQRFLLKVAPPADEALGGECAAMARETEEVLASVRDRVELAALSEPLLKIRQLQGLARWSADISEARLKISLGTAEALSGVCSWKRFERVSSKFDSDAFAKAHPDLARRYVSAPKARTAIVTRKTKPQGAAARKRSSGRRRRS